MGASAGYLNRAVTAFCAAWFAAAPALAETRPQAQPPAQSAVQPQPPGQAQPLPPDQVQQLKDLKSDDYSTWRKAESDLLREWSNSGSPAMDLLLERARTAMAGGDYPTAIAHLTALIDHAPAFEDAYNARAEAYYQQGLFGPAVSDIGKALTLNPNDFRALTGLGLILEAMHKRKDALAAFRMAKSIHPHLQTVLDAIKKLEAKSAGQEL